MKKSRLFASKYEGRVKSTGACPMIPAVMPEMLESLLKDFPKQSGSTHAIDLPGMELVKPK